jgi:aromatic-L-amino-acid/L-tryptophan decarboxylase
MSQAEQRAVPERKSVLEMSPEAFRAAGYELIDSIAALLSDISDRPVAPGESPAAVRDLLDRDRPLPHEGTDPRALLSTAASLLIDHSVFNGHPRFFGYVTSSAAPIGALADLLAAAVNPNVGAWRLSPMASEIEAQTICWIAELIGYPRSCGGLLVSGGNMANFIGFLAARAAACGDAVRSEGIHRRLRCYCSAETHTWIQKAADMFGLGTGSIRWIPAGPDQRMDVAALRSQVDADIQDGDRPFLVVGTAGSVSTGAVDPLRELASFCRERQLWFHVDGAYGGLAAAVPGVPEDLAALTEADSVAVDPHKWLYAPLEAGCALVRNPQHLVDAFSYRPPYYNFDNGAINYFDFGPQNSRGFRALKVWLALQQAGRSGYVEMISEDIRLSKLLYRLIAEHPDFEALTQSLSIATFRYAPPLRTEEELNALNQELLNRLESSGRAFLSNAILDGKYALRACIVNFRTSEADIRALPAILAEIGAAL